MKVLGNVQLFIDTSYIALIIIPIYFNGLLLKAKTNST